MKWEGEVWEMWMICERDEIEFGYYRKKYYLCSVELNRSECSLCDAGYIYEAVHKQGMTDRKLLCLHL